MFEIARYDGKGFTSVLTDNEDAANFLMEYIRFNGADRYQHASMHTAGAGWQIMVFGKKKWTQNLVTEAVTSWMARDVGL